MRSIATIITSALTAALMAQGPVSLTLREAMDLAAKQSYAVQASTLEAEKAEARIKEVTAIGLPQISAAGTLNNYIEVPTQVVPNFFGGEPELLEVQFGVPWSMSGSVQLNQLIFDGSYIVGLKASRELRVRSQKELEQTALDSRIQAAQAYLGTLAAEEGVRLIGETLPVLEKAASEAAAMVEQGMMESTDSDRLAVQLNEARNQERMLQRQVQVARAFLALVLGLPSGSSITLTDALDPLLTRAGDQDLLTAPFDPAQHVDQELANSVVRLGELDVRNKKAAYMPQLAGFLNYQQQYNYTSFEPGNGNYWFPASLWGIQLNVPIFSSGMRHQQVRQAQLSLQQAQVNQKATEQRLLTDHLNQQAVLSAAQQNFETGRTSLALNRSIFERVSVKFSEGVSSSFELTQEQSNYLAAQQTYLQRIVDLVRARIDMQKALDLY